MVIFHSYVSFPKDLSSFFSSASYSNFNGEHGDNPSEYEIHYFQTNPCGFRWDLTRHDDNHGYNAGYNMVGALEHEWWFGIPT